MKPATTVLALIIVALCVGVLSARWIASAQPAEKVYRVGWLSQSRGADPLRLLTRDGFLRKMRDFGYVEGRNLIFESRWAEGDAERLPGLAADLVRVGVDVIVATAPPAAHAAAKATTTIPVVIVGVGSPVERGLVASLARPGGNVTGLSFDVGPQIWGKRLELLKEMLPRLSRAVYLADPLEGRPTIWQVLQAVAPAMGVALQRVDASAPGDFDNALAAIGRMRVDALLVHGSPLHNDHRARIQEFAMKHRIPTMSPNRIHVDAGGLVSYGPSTLDLFVRAATYVHKILNGAWPGDLPVERPTKFELVINLKTAKTLGLTIPPALLQRADEVIR
ncbi:MAG: ABC transporter substrate-binding protein [Candidatus Rokuibacteriota bacterium]